MSTVTIVLLVILVILIAAVIALYFFGKKAQKKQDEQQAQIQANKQTVSMLVIDKKRMPLKDSAVHMEQQTYIMTDQMLSIFSEISFRTFPSFLCKPFICKFCFYYNAALSFRKLQ